MTNSDLGGIHGLLGLAATGKRFGKADKAATVKLLDPMYAELRRHRSPPGFRLASGELAKGATGRIALNAYFLLLGRKALGQNFTRDGRLREWWRYLGFSIMRSTFVGGTPKGLYCCATCTFSCFPLYCTGVYADLAGDEMKRNVIEAYEKKAGRFACKFSRKYADWAMCFA